MTRQEELIEAWCKYMGKCSTEIVQALAFALRWCDQHPRWISVEDELPPNDDTFFDLSIDVLATNGNDIYKGFYDSSIKGWLTVDFWHLDSITHWMALPKPPEHFADVSKKISSSEIPNNHTKTIEKGGEQ